MFHSASDKAKLFAKNFSNNSNLLGISFPTFPARTNLELYNIDVTPTLVQKVMIKHSCGGSEELWVWTLIHTSWGLEYFVREFCTPDCLKVSSVFPVLKNIGERSMTRNYCHVSLLSVVNKITEKRVDDRLFDHLEKYGLWSLLYGFRSSWSTPDLLTIVSYRIARAFNRPIRPIIKSFIHGHFVFTFIKGEIPTCCHGKETKRNMEDLHSFGIIGFELHFKIFWPSWQGS